MKNQHTCKNNRSSRAFGGIVLLGLGIFFLGRNLGLYIPGWIFSWSTFLLLIGLVIGYKHRFRFGGWLVPTLIGAFFTVDHIIDGAFNLSRYSVAVIFIILGLYVIFKPRKTVPAAPFSPQPEPLSQVPSAQAYETPLDQPAAATEKSALDVLESVNIFGGSHQKVFSKSFSGGEVVAVFGGCDINMSQADIQGVVVLEIVAVCGGVKLVVPSGWQVKSEITAIMGGVDDKRGMAPFTEASSKILVIKGLALFGGVEIKNF
ncbi:hypothetical protein C7T94_15275 [Pedobacter yulinensis]|uniref:LiaF transmembrane domain-containing protein n=1 Tax=Pedobacter yulinensis TaxID=2126353 RepID=A0A2T3HI99_9SPHI|nr:hypothetical protein [Pedobacter yulinensis]PST82162.1 hypothetical protein C7T94_15275 [Pedobacter yulinensis]